MADNINLDELSDEDFLAALTSENAVYEDDATSVEREQEETEKLEDTNQDSDADEEDETNDDDDGQIQDTSEPAVDDNEENSQEEDLDDSEESDDNSSDDNEDEDDSESESEDDTQTTSENDDGSKESDEVDYKAEYEAIKADKEKLQSFYDEITSEFTANGRKVRGFTDPKKIIKSQQMSASYSDRMAALKPYRPLMKPLKERGYLDDPEKFNFAMQVMDGDEEAIKKFLKDKNIDPFEFDMETINPEQKQYTASKIDIAVDEMFEDAQRIGVDKQLQEAFSRDWDDSSVVSILEDKNYQQDLLDHIASGAYDIIQDKITEIKRSDMSGQYANLSKIDQYKQAIVTINKEQSIANEINSNANSTAGSEAEVKTQAEPAVKVSAKEEEEYKKKVASDNKKAANARKKAASVSRKKSGTKKNKQQFDPDKLSDEEFESMIQDMILN